MTCEDFDVLLCDYVDGTLSAEKRQLAEVHIGTCTPCASLVRDSRFVMDFAGRAAEVEPPRELVTRILNEAPRGGFSERLLSGGLKSIFAPVLQPRFVMGAMMTVLSLSMMTRCAGAPKHALTASDLDPVRLLGSFDDKIYRTWDRSIKAYESMRVVYEVQSRVAEWKQKQQEDEDESLRLPKSRVETQPAKEQWKEKEGPSK